MDEYTKGVDNVKDFNIDEVIKTMSDLALMKPETRQALILLPDTISQFNVLKIDEDIMKQIIPYLCSQQERRNNGEKLLLDL